MVESVPAVASGQCGVPALRIHRAIRTASLIIASLAGPCCLCRPTHHVPAERQAVRRRVVPTVDEASLLHGAVALITALVPVLVPAQMPARMSIRLPTMKMASLVASEIPPLMGSLLDSLMDSLMASCSHVRAMLVAAPASLGACAVVVVGVEEAVVRRDSGGEVPRRRIGKGRRRRWQ